MCLSNQKDWFLYNTVKNGNWFWSFTARSIVQSAWRVGDCKSVCVSGVASLYNLWMLHKLVVVEKG
jgi:hypothetical protein